MRLAGFDEGEDGNEDGEGDEDAVADDGLKGERLGGGEAAAIDVHVKKVGTRDDDPKSDHDQRDEARPDAHAPSNQEQQTESDLRERQSVRDEIHASRRQKFVSGDLQGEIREIRGHREFDHEPARKETVRKEELGVTGEDKDGGEDEAADQDEDAAQGEGAGLHHGFILRALVLRERVYF